MKALDLILDHATGQLSHTKLWANVGNAAMTTAFLHVAFTTGVNETLFLAYGAIVTGSALASKVVSAKFKPAGAAP